MAIRITELPVETQINNSDTVVIIKNNKVRRSRIKDLNINEFKSISSDYTLEELDGILLCDATSGEINIQLPNSSTITGKQYGFLKTDSSDNSVFINASVSDSINSDISVKSLNSKDDFILLTASQSCWYITVEKASENGNVTKAELDQEIADRIADVNAEEARATSVENSISGSILSISTLLSNEIDRATTADNSIDQRLDIIEGANTLPGSIAYAVKTESDRAIAEETSIRSAFANADLATLTSANGYTDNKISTLVGTAPQILDTIHEIADALQDEQTATSAILTAISNETSRANGAESILDARLDILEAGNAISGSVAYAIKVETDRALAAEASLQNQIDNLPIGGDSGSDARLDILEGSSTTLGSVAYAVKQESDRAIAEEADIRADFAAADSSTLSSANNYADTKIAQLVGTAPAILDTLGEIASALQNEQNATTTILTAISNEVTRATNAENALDDRLDILEGSDTATGSVAYAVKIEADRAIAAESGLQTQINTLNSGAYTTYFITSDVSSSGIVLSDLPGLLFSVSANAIYLVELMYLFSSSVTTTGLRVGYSATNCTATGQYLIPTSLSVGLILSNRASGASTISTGVDVINANLLTTGTFLVIGGTSDGTFKLQYASEVSATFVTVKLGSNMRVTRLA